VTWFEFAYAAAERTGRRAERVARIETARAWGPAVRPRFSALASARGQRLRPLDEALDAYLQDAADTSCATGTDA
jgi:dTDP-4-dehydrorhamnose reductase